MDSKDFRRLWEFSPEASSFSTLIFTGERCPSLFFSLLLPLWGRKLGITFQNYNLSEDDLDHQLGGLAMSFLGQSCWYWLGDCSSLKPEYAKKVLLWSESYQGPHRCVFFIKSSSRAPLAQGKHSLVIPCLEFVDRNWYEECADFLFPDNEGQKLRIPSSVPLTRMTIDEACTIMRYQSLMGGGDQAFWKSWVPRLLSPDRSLFTLSQYFFAGDQSAFMASWNAVRGDYPPEFWIVFWSEQVWQAYGVLAGLQPGATPQRQPGSRLPFSFLQKDWKRHSVRGLASLHNALYSFDHSLKNGAGEFGLDALLARFLLSVRQ